MNPKTLTALLMASAMGGSPLDDLMGGLPSMPGDGGVPSQEELEELLDGAPDGIREILGMPPKAYGFTASGVVRSLNYEVKFEYTGDVPSEMDVKLALINALTRFGMSLHTALAVAEEMGPTMRDALINEGNHQDLILALDVGDQILQLRADKRHDVTQEFLGSLIPRLEALEEIPAVVYIEMHEDHTVTLTGHRLLSSGALKEMETPEGIDLSAGLGWFPLAKDYDGHIRVRREGKGPDCGPVVDHRLLLSTLDLAQEGGEEFERIGVEAAEQIGADGVCSKCSDTDCPEHPTNLRKAAPGEEMAESSTLVDEPDPTA
jgi:hypothetical protein